MSLLPVCNEGCGGPADPGYRSSLYDHIIQGRITELPDAIRTMHCSLTDTEASGVFRVDQPETLRARILGWLMRLPRAAERVPVTLRIDRIDGMETWRRLFGSRTLTSSQREDQGILVERFGPVSFAFELHADNGTLRFIQSNTFWTFGGWNARVPTGVAPQIHAAVASDAGELLVEVSIGTRWAGVLLRYTGTLIQQKAEAC